MKQRLLILILLLPLLASAQNYPIVKDSAVWRKISNYLINPPNHFGTHKIQYLMQGDTIINNQSYKKVFSTQYDSLIYSLDYIGAMRENDSGQVYFLRSPVFVPGHLYSVPDTMEILLYDFSLQQGDTFHLQVDVGSFYDSAFTVDYTDSVLVDGSWRKRIVFN